MQVFFQKSWRVRFNKELLELEFSLSRLIYLFAFMLSISFDVNINLIRSVMFLYLTSQ